VESPPPVRRIQGDLLYIEIITEEGVFHITSTGKGYYVNKSTRLIFDPNPNTKSHFSSELFTTLLGVSCSARSVWHTLCTHNEPVNTMDLSSGALDTINSFYNQGREDLVFVRPQSQWNVPMKGTFGNVLTDKHTYDVSRLHDDLSDQFGSDERGGPREWNEEMQSMRAYEGQNLSEKINQAKFVRKIYAEFIDAARTGVLAITEGHIVPINPVDPERTQVFVYNNIFYSRAVDTKENFEVCQGDDAHRKLAGHDVKNQRSIQSMNINSLSTVLSCVIDYMGDRITAQTIIPGVLQVGLHSARILYGCLEGGKRLSVKNEALSVMEVLFSKLFIKRRTISAIPNVILSGPVYIDGQSVKDKATVALSGILKEVEDTPQALGVIVDAEDEVVPIDSEFLTHVGCLEIKMIKGTDDRTYILDATRLTPRDANFVKGLKGTNNIPLESLSYVDSNIAVTYVLRHELVGTYVQHKTLIMKEEIKKVEIQYKKELAKGGVYKKLVDFIPEESEHKGIDKKIGKVQGVPLGKVHDSNKIESNVLSQDEDTGRLDKESSKTIDEKMDLKELERRLEAVRMKPENLPIQLNPNCFIDGFDCDVDPTVVLKDEKIARDIADFLYNQVLVTMTDQIRLGDYCPIDNEGIVELLHAQGINMRYLGRLAVLAYESEKQDRCLHLTNRQRIQGMPFYWLEMIEIEVLSRCFKHHLNKLFQGHQEIKQQPARTVVTLLNHLLGTTPKGHANHVETLVNFNRYLNPIKIKLNGTISNASKNKKKK